MTHDVSIEHWSEHYETYHARCSCGWAAEYGHSKFEPARLEALHHRASTWIPTASQWADDHWLPGV